MHPRKDDSSGNQAVLDHNGTRVPEQRLEKAIARSKRALRKIKMVGTRRRADNRQESRRRSATVPLRPVSDERQEKRKQDAEATLTALEDRRSGRNTKQQAKGSVRVSLVKHRAEQPSEGDMTDPVDCARYTIAGTDWMKRGDKISSVAPFQSVFNEVILVDACIVAGCTDEFLLGVDFMKSRGATMDFNSNEVAAVRLVGRSNLSARAVTPIEVSIAAKDGECGIFIPTRHTGAVTLAATVTTARNGKAWVPAVNPNSRVAKLPNKKELGTWVPVDQDMTVVEMQNELEPTRLQVWLDEMGDSETPLENEDEVHIETKKPKARELILRLLRVYRQLTGSKSDCPPWTFTIISILERQLRSCLNDVDKRRLKTR
ncbi:hypothetical protein PHMEG_00030758 [Phytophthora megakarya]|uniref:Uncharacterized protein n=1 Tax=Phytophthora megakarya TaxID=4795 RepID=A0A225UZK6_9STRA|nr:hypothetical protein PHMEG_00030758 [Phytophthora megakarya]